MSKQIHFGDKARSDVGSGDAFDIWNNEKKSINKKQIAHTYINPGEIWYIKLGVNIGFEQNGKKEFRRPVLVVKRIGNMYFCIPLTTKGKDSPFYQKIKLFGSDRDSFLIVSQGRSFDKRRFMDTIGTV